MFLLCLPFNSQPQTNNLAVSPRSSGTAFPLANNKSIASFCYDKADAAVVGIAAAAFKEDVKAIIGKEISLSATGSISGEYVIVAGTIGHSAVLNELISAKLVNVSAVKGKWESFSITVINNSYKKTKKLLVIAGSDRRGTAFGIFHLSRLMGVSPFVWWADVSPAKRQELFVTGSYISNTPSVKYRGIFINDEDWGIQPWAAKNLDAAIKDIGPKTYARVFELMLRLKANYIWPAMHPCTKAFYYYEDNPKIADDYAIIVGGSHCEPMLRNNVFEWAENFEHEYGKKPGEWRYDQNKDEIYKYWDDRVKQAVTYESIYTVGMRGIHDGSMPGPKDPGEKLKLLENVIIDQRRILQQNFHKLASAVPQIFVPYKEVLSLYRRGLPLADDVTIIWPDDNHGYIRQLPDETERKRSGGHGIYYHLSYWGAPHDYLWLSSISPSLVAYEMNKAYYYGADKLWVFNAGDIKPAEMELQFAMDMAWDIKKYSPVNAVNYLNEWATEIFGKENAAVIASIKKEYYILAQAAKPEHLGMVEFSTAVADKRLAAYHDISNKVLQLQPAIPGRLQDAYFQLILYPVLSAGLMNQKIFFEKRSNRQKTENNIAASNELFAKAFNAFDSIKLLTEQYNTKIAAGKWNAMMSWHPRDLKIFNPPAWDTAGQARITLQNTLQDRLVKILLATDLHSSAHPHTRVVWVVDGIGPTGNAMMPLPVKGAEWHNATSAEIKVSGDVQLQPGSYVIAVKWLPTFDVGNRKKLEYAIWANDETPQVVNIHAEAESAAWKENVVKGYSTGKTIHNINKDGKTTISIRIKNINMVLLSVEVYKNN